VFVDDSVMHKAAVAPEAEIDSEGESPPTAGEGRLDAFKDFVETLDLDSLDQPDEDDSLV